MGLDRLRLAFGWTILIGWTISLVAEFVSRSYHPDQTINILAMAVAGALFGPSIARKRNGTVSR